MVIPPSVPGNTNPPDEWPRNPLNNYSGSQADGRHSSFTGPLPPPFPPGVNTNPGLFDPHNQPILHGNPYGPSGTEAAPNCQAGQTGYAFGEALLPGQQFENPTFGIPNIAQAAGVPPLGKTDMFIRQNGAREFAP